jgi:hypothetical protein
VTFEAKPQLSTSFVTLKRAGDDFGGDLCQVLCQPGPGSSVGRARG